MIECPACGAKNSEQAEYCEICGEKLMPYPETSSPSENNPKTIPIEEDSSLDSKSEVVSSEVSSESISTTGMGNQPKIIKKMEGKLTNEIFESQEQDKNYFTIGRFHHDTGPVDIDLSDLSKAEAEYISRRHALMTCNESGQWFIDDNGSKNGTFVRPKGQQEWKPVKNKQAINHRDEIAFGKVKFEFRLQ